MTINSPAVKGYAFHADITGNNFQDDKGSVVSASLMRSAYTDITASNLVVTSSGMLTCDFNLTSAAAGNWSVVLSDNYSQKSKANVILSVCTATPTPAITSISTITPTTTSTPLLPDKFLKIYQSQINPTRGEEARITWCQPQTGPVTITIYNMLGEKVATLADHQEYPAGQYHEVTWKGITQNGRVVGSGIYIVHIQAGQYQDKAKICVAK